jgi:choline dehydrogenase
LTCGVLVDFNFLATETDKYVYREALRQITRLMLDTEFGKKYIVGESVPEGLEPLALDDSDEKLNTRMALTGAMTWHATGSCSMGKVIDTEFRVRGVEGLRVVDGSAVPVPLSAHVQAPLFAMSEQAAAIIAGKA